MPITNSPLQPGKVVDLSSDINIIPNEWGWVQRLGLFTPKYGRTKTVMVPRKTEDQHLMVDRNWDERNPTISGGQRDWITYAIPHYPVDDAILPNDIDGVIDFDSLIRGGMQLETVGAVRAEKMARIRRAHATVLELARLQVLKNGTVYAPNGTVTTNYYTEYNISRETFGLNLASPTIRPSVGIGEAVGYLQDTLQNGEMASAFVALCSSDFFDDLVNNAFIQESYLYFQRAQGENLLNATLNRGSRLGALSRQFEYGGVTFIEVRGGIGSTKYIEDGEAYMFPLGTEQFETWFAPANRLSTVNKAALESYYFEYPNSKDDIIEIMSETNFLNVLKRPDLVVTLEVGA